MPALISASFPFLELFACLLVEKAAQLRDASRIYRAPSVCLWLPPPRFTAVGDLLIAMATEIKLSQISMHLVTYGHIKLISLASCILANPNLYMYKHKYIYNTCCFTRNSAKAKKVINSHRVKPTGISFHHSQTRLLPRSCAFVSPGYGVRSCPLAMQYLW